MALLASDRQWGRGRAAARPPPRAPRRFGGGSHRQSRKVTGRQWACPGEWRAPPRARDESWHLGASQGRSKATRSLSSGWEWGAGARVLVSRSGQWAPGVFPRSSTVAWKVACPQQRLRGGYGLRNSWQGPRALHRVSTPGSGRQGWATQPLFMKTCLQPDLGPGLQLANSSCGS